MCSYRSTLLLWLYLVGMSSGVSISYAAVTNSSHSLEEEKAKAKIASYYYNLGLCLSRKGKFEESIKFLQKAALLGSIGANWKLGVFYDEGTGVAQDHAKALAYYQTVIKSSVAVGSSEEFFISDSLLRLGNYFYYGSGHDFKLARYYYFQAATNFANAKAQYYLGLMMLNGLGGKRDEVSAAGWFQLAAQKGYLPAQAMFGDMVLRAGNIPYGLAMIMDAYYNAERRDKSWIKHLYDHAFALANMKERRLALALRQKLKDGN